MSFRHEHVKTNGIRLHVVESGRGFPVLFAHGFPEIWYSWRHQLRALAEAGYRAIAPDQRGYGDSDAPEAIDAYAIHHLVGDLTGVLDVLEIDKAVVVGHDWGGIVVWQMALLAPERVAGVVGINTPFLPRPPMRPTEMLRAMFQQTFNYVLYFQEPGVAEAELEPNLRRMLRAFYRDPDRDALAQLLRDPASVLGPAGGGLLDRLPEGPLGSFLSAQDFDVYVEAFAKSGLRGGLNWYRNLDRNWETTEHLAGAQVQQPALMITAELDPVLRPELAAGMEAWVPHLRRTVLVEGAGHWTQQEKPDEVNAALLAFLEEIAAGNS